MSVAGDGDGCWEVFGRVIELLDGNVRRKEEEELCGFKYEPFSLLPVYYREMAADGIV